LALFPELSSLLVNSVIGQGLAQDSISWLHVNFIRKYIGNIIMCCATLGLRCQIQEVRIIMIVNNDYHKR